ncbi:MAG: D-aminoacyl-tRNA deacylase [Pyrinomonadaceae bacterium]
MRAVVQRVRRASVSVDGEVVGQIGVGLLILVAVATDDTERDIKYTAEKVVSLRIFDDEHGVMNRSVIDTGGSLLAVSQFTLYGDVRRGRRPSWIDSAPPEIAEPLYERFVAVMRELIPRVETGTFRAQMQVELVNDGPVTILVDSRKVF